MAYPKRRRVRSMKRRAGSSRAGRRRLVNNPTLTRNTGTQVTSFRGGGIINRRSGSILGAVNRPALSLAGHANTLATAMEVVNNWHKMAGMLKSKSNVKALKQTNATMRGNYHDRHEKLKQPGTIGPVNKGKGFNSNPNGVLITHGQGVVPKWKRKRLYEYKYHIWQTVLLSKSNRMPASNNVLNSYRYPIKAPECKDAETLQCMLFSPWCSNFSGIHTTMFRKINAAGTDLDHSTEYLDVIQNKVDISRHSLPGNVDAVHGTAIVYESDFAGGAITAGTARGATNVAQAQIYFNQLVKGVKVDLSFMASRAFPMRVGVSLVRFIKTSPANTWDADDKKMLLNNLDYKGMEYSKYKVEWNHQFVLPGLMKNRKPPRYSIKKLIKCNFLQTNTFEKNNVSEIMTQAASTALGKGISVRMNEVADGDVSSQFYLLIKYRKVQKPQQFTYTQTIAESFNSAGYPAATVSTPVISESSFDIPVPQGNIDGLGSSPQDGTPLAVNQGNEALGSFYIHGKIQYQWGFKRECESIPSIVSSDPSHADYKKAQSLCIDPTKTDSDTDGLYTESPSHVQLAASTANTGP